MRCVASLVAGMVLSCPTACGILVPPSGIKPSPPALEGRLPTTGPSGKFSFLNFFEKWKYFMFLKIRDKELFYFLYKWDMQESGKRSLNIRKWKAHCWVLAQSSLVTLKHKTPSCSLKWNQNLDMHVTQVIQIKKNGNNSNNSNVYHFYYLQGTFIYIFIWYKKRSSCDFMD